MKEYLRFTRAPWPSYLFVLPLLVGYHLAVLVANLGHQRVVYNGADGIVQRLVGLFGLQGWIAVLVLTAIAGAAVYRIDAAHRKKPPRWQYFPPLLAECALYALLFGTVVGLLASAVLPFRASLEIGGGALSFLQKLAVSLGAGLYEELVFRLGLTGLLLWAFRKLKWKEGAAAALAVLVSSLLFSLFHYVGPLADPFQAGSFTFRFVAGLVLAALFWLRGFAVAAWTHALYDVFLLFSGRA